MLSNIMDFFKYFLDFFVMIGLKITVFIAHIFHLLQIIVFLFWGFLKLVLRRTESTWSSIKKKHPQFIEV